jgi:hypothetical protein
MEMTLGLIRKDLRFLRGLFYDVIDTLWCRGSMEGRC